MSCTGAYSPYPGGELGRSAQRTLHVIIMLIITLAPAPMARGDLEIKKIGAWGGLVEGIFVQDNGEQTLAYVGSGARMLIFDVTAGGDPVELGSVMLQGVVRSIAVRGDYAYVGALHPALFSVVNVADPCSPVVVSTGNGNGAGGLSYKTMALDVAGEYAYVGVENASGHVFDVRDPENPIFHWPAIGADPYVIRDDYAYWVYWSWDQFYVGVCELNGPVCENFGWVEFSRLFEDYALAADAAVYGDYFYVAVRFVDYSTQPEYSYSLLYVFDISDPSAPALVNTWGDPTGQEFYFLPLDASDGRLYWAGTAWNDPTDRTLAILDIGTDPTSPTLLGTYASGATFGSITAVGTTAYLGDVREGLTILDCSDPAAPVRVGSYFSPSSLAQGALVGNRLYVTDYSHGLTILDVADARTPGLLGEFETGVYTEDAVRLRMNNWGVAVRDNLAYVAAGRAGLQVVDVTDPADPVLAGAFSPWPEGVQSVGLALSPNEAVVHVGTYPGAFIVNFDVSDLGNIVDVGSVGLGASAKPSTIARRADGIAYVARDTGLVTLDLADPEEPTLLHIGTCSDETGPCAVDLVLDGEYLYTVFNENNNPASGMDILDVSAEDHIPVPVGHYGGSDLWAYSVAAENGRAYVGMINPLGLRVVDVADPSSPFLLGLGEVGSVKISDLIVDWPTIYAVTSSYNDGGAGVLVYQVFNPGDRDDDGDVDLEDFIAFAECLTGPDNPPEDADCLVFDFKEWDGDIDLADFAAFQNAFTEAP